MIRTAGVCSCSVGAAAGCLWHDGQGMCLFAKRPERGCFIWPSWPTAPAQLGHLSSRASTGDVATDVATAGILLIGHCKSPYDCEFTGASAVIPSVAMGIDNSLPIDLAGAHALIIAQRQAPSAAQERVAAAERGRPNTRRC